MSLSAHRVWLGELKYACATMQSTTALATILPPRNGQRWGYRAACGACRFTVTGILCGYHAEVNQYNRSSTLMSAYGKMQHPDFRKTIIRDKSGVYAALRCFFSHREDGVKPA